MNTKKFLIYKKTGGLAHCIGGLSKAIKLAQEQKRFLIIDFKNKQKEVLIDFSDFFILENNPNYSTNYDNIPDNYAFEGLSKDIIKNSNPIHGDQGYEINGVSLLNIRNNYIKNDSELTVFADCAEADNHITIKELKVIPQIMTKLENEPEIKENYISIHFRKWDGPDGIIRNDINNFIQKIKLMSNEYNINTVYLASDDNDAFFQISNSLPNIKLIRYTIPEELNTGRDDTMHYSCKDSYKIMYTALLDMYMILKSYIFYPTVSSGFSYFIMKMIKEEINIFNIKTKTIIYS